MRGGLLVGDFQVCLRPLGSLLLVCGLCRRWKHYNFLRLSLIVFLVLGAVCSLFDYRPLLVYYTLPGNTCSQLFMWLSERNWLRKSPFWFLEPLPCEPKQSSLLACFPNLALKSPLITKSIPLNLSTVDFRSLEYFSARVSSFATNPIWGA